MESVVQICDAHLTNHFVIGDNVTDKSITKTLTRLAPTINETMMMCKFQNTLQYCNKYFDELMTDEGRCFTFNMINSEELFRDGYASSLGIKIFGNIWSISVPF